MLFLSRFLGTADHVRAMFPSLSPNDPTVRSAILETTSKTAHLCQLLGGPCDGLGQLLDTHTL